MAKVILIGQYLYNECGYIASQDEVVATFDSKDLAEDYVIKSIVKSVKRNYTTVSGEEETEFIEFKPNSILAEFNNYEIKEYDIPHNPIMEE